MLVDDSTGGGNDDDDDDDDEKNGEDDDSDEDRHALVTVAEHEIDALDMQEMIKCAVATGREDAVALKTGRLKDTSLASLNKLLQALCVVDVGLLGQITGLEGADAHNARARQKRTEKLIRECPLRADKGKHNLSPLALALEKCLVKDVVTVAADENLMIVGMAFNPFNEPALESFNEAANSREYWPKSAKSTSPIGSARYFTVYGKHGLPVKHVAHESASQQHAAHLISVVDAEDSTSAAAYHDDVEVAASYAPHASAVDNHVDSTPKQSVHDLEVLVDGPPRPHFMKVSYSDGVVVGNSNTRAEQTHSVKNYIARVNVNMVLTPDSVMAATNARRSLCARLQQIAHRTIAGKPPTFAMCLLRASLPVAADSRALIDNHLKDEFFAATRDGDDVRDGAPAIRLLAHGVGVQPGRRQLRVCRPARPSEQARPRHRQRRHRRAHAQDQRTQEDGGALADGPHRQTARSPLASVLRQTAPWTDRERD
jgi:hypothetical protein